MKYIILYLIASIIFGPVAAQRIITHYSITDIDDSYNFMDTGTVKRGYHILDLYSCQGNRFNKDSCVHYMRQQLDSAGRLVELINGEDLVKKKINYWVKYKRLSDSSCEAIIKYPPGSQNIPELIFVDTVIKGKPRHLSLYKKDREGNIVLRSVYYANKYELKIERYDLDNKLVQIFYPLGINERKAEWVDSTETSFNKTVTYHTTFPGNEYVSGDVVDKDGRLLETFYVNRDPANMNIEMSKTVFVYDTASNPVRKITLDKNNRFVSEEQYVYKNKRVVRYTMDYNLLDNDVNEEKVFDENGRLVMSRSRPPYLNPDETTWKYFYREDGLKEREDLYNNGEYKGSRFYRFQ
jgi:hypothetical protein